MTISAKSLALICIVILVVGMYGENTLLAVPSLAVLFWMIGVYARFSWVHRLIRRSLIVERKIQERSQESVYLWADRLYSVELRLQSRQRFPESLQFRDIVPDLMLLPGALSDGIQTEATRSQQVLRSKPRSWGSWFWGQLLPVENKRGAYDHNSFEVVKTNCNVVYEYRIRPRAAGVAIFPGVRIEHTDSMKWFRADYSIECKQVVQVLPKYRQEAEIRQMLKTTNAIPQHGLHRQRKPGMGFELLELREYVDGDSPKSIAWKASARRDTLMIRQYESEVPVRVQLFVEATVGCRIGSYGHRVIDQMTLLATSIAKVVTSYGDAIGGYLVDPNGVTRLSASFGESGFYKIAKGLSLFSSGDFPNRFRWTLAMQQAVYALIGEYYPDLIKMNINPSHLRFFEFSLTRFKRQRNQICNVLAEHYCLNDLEHVEMIVNDDTLAKWMQKYLCEHGREWIYPMIPETDVPYFLSQNAIGNLVRSVQQAVQIAKDNEVFIVIVDLLSVARDIDGLLQALKVARGKHHRVVVIAQSPTFEPLQKCDLRSLGDTSTVSPEEWRQLASKLEYEERYRHIKSTISSIGVPFSVTSDDSSISLVLKEVELARTGRLSARAGSVS